MDGQAVCDDINWRCFGDCHVREKGGNALLLWIGDCCGMCSDSVLVTFRGVTSTAGLDDARAFEVPWFRLATDAEQNTHWLFAEPDEQVYCIEPKRQRGVADAPRVFVVARSIALEPYVEHDLTINR